MDCHSGKYNSRIAIIAVLSLLIVGIVFVGSAAAFSGGGSGTEADPYQITTTAQWFEMANAPSAYYIMMNDLDFTGVTYTPISLISGTGQPWRGHLDGNGKTVKNVTYSGGWMASLFGYVESCSIKSFNCDHIHISTTADTGSQGIVIGYAGANCDFLGISINNSWVGDGNSDQIGGFIGSAYFTIKAQAIFMNNSVVYGRDHVGGIIGYLGSNNAGTIDTSFTINTCFIQGNASVGGLIGTVGNDTSYQTFTVTNDMTAYNSIIYASGSGARCAGLIGSMLSTSRIYMPLGSAGVQNCTIYGTYVGGITVADSTNCFSANYVSCYNNNIYGSYVWGVGNNIDPSSSGSINKCNIYGIAGYTDIAGGSTYITAKNLLHVNSYAPMYDRIVTRYDGTADKVYATVYTKIDGTQREQNIGAGVLLDHANYCAVSGYEWEITNNTTGDVYYFDTPTSTFDGNVAFDWSGKKRGEYTAKLTIKTNISGSNSVTSNFIVPPYANVSVSPSTGGRHETVTFTADLHLNTGDTWTWQQSDDEGVTYYDISKTATWTNTFNDSMNTVHYYRVKVHDSKWGDDFYKEVTYTSSEPPTYTGLHWNKSKAALDDELTLWVDSTEGVVEGSPSTFQWQEFKNGGWQDTGRNYSTGYFHIVDAVPTTHEFRLWLWNEAGETVSPTITYQTYYPPTLNSISVYPTVGSLTQTIQLFVYASDTNTYKWYDSTDGGTTWTAITGEETDYHIYYTLSDTESSTHLFKVVLTGYGGQVSPTDTTTFTSYKSPSITNVKATPSIGSFNRSIVLSADVTDATSYQWQENIGGTWTAISGATSASSTITISDTTPTLHTYQLTASNSIGLVTTSDSVTYQSANVPTIVSTNALPNYGKAGTETALWVVATSTTGGTLSYEWKNGAGTVIGNTATVQYNIPSVGSEICTVTVTDSVTGLSSIGTVTLYSTASVPSLSVTASNPEVFFVNVSTDLSFQTTSSTTSATYDYQEKISGEWITFLSGTKSEIESFIDATPTTHYFRVIENVTGESKSVASDIVTISSMNAITIDDIQISKINGALTDSVTVSVTATSVDPLTYQWQEKIGSNWTDIAGATSASSTLTISDTAPKIHTYRVKVSNNLGGYVYSDILTFRSYNAPSITRIYAYPTQGGLTSTFQLCVIASSMNTCQWQEDIDGTWTDVAGATSSTSNVTLSDTSGKVHTYRVIVYGYGGTATSTNTVTFTSYNPPKINKVEVLPPVGKMSQSIVLSVDASDAVGFKWYEFRGSGWYEISGATSAQSTITISDPRPMSHEYKVKVWNEVGQIIESSPVWYQSVNSPTITSINANPNYGALGTETALWVTATSPSGSTLTYEWKNGEGTVIGTASSIQYTISPTGTSEVCTVTVTDTSTGLTDTATVTLYVTTGTPVLEVEVSNPECFFINESTELLFTTTPTASTAGYEYQEKVNGEWVSLMSGGVVEYETFIDATPTTHYFRVIEQVSGEDKKIASNIVTISSMNPITVTNEQISKTKGALTDSVTVSATATSVDPLTYQWQEKIGDTWTNITGATSASSTLTISDTTPKIHTYRLKVSNNLGGYVYSDTLTFTSYSAPTVTEISSDPTQGGLSASVELSVTATETNSYQWQENIGGTWTDISGATSATYTHTVSDTTPTVHTYRVVLTGYGGVVNSDTVTYTSYKLPSITNEKATPAIGKLSQTVVLSADVTDAVNVQWQELIGSQWEDIQYATTASYTITISDTTPTTHTYRLKAMNIVGDVYSNNVTYTSAHLPVITSTDAYPNYGAAGSDTVLSVIASTTSGGTLSYEWTNGAGTVIGNTVTVDYTIPSTASEVCTVKVTDSATGLSVTATVTLYSTTDTPALDVEANDPEVFFIGVPTELLFTTTPTASTASYDYQEKINGEWVSFKNGGVVVYETFTDTTPTTHYFRVIEQVSGEDKKIVSNVVTISSMNPITIDDVQISKTKGALTDSVTVSVTATSVDPLTYQWQEKIGDTWTNITGATSASSTITISDSTSTTHTYRVKVSNSIGGYIYSDTLTFTSYNAPSVTAISSDPTQGGLSASVELSVTATETNSYQWQENIGGTWTNISGATSATYTHTVSDTTPTVHTYRVVLTGYGGVVNSDTVTYTSYKLPTITNVKATPPVGGLSQTVVLSADVTDAVNVQWQELIGSYWEDIMGASSASSTITISDTTPTTHTYRLKAMNIAGDVYSNTVTYTSNNLPVIVSLWISPSKGALEQDVVLSSNVTNATSYQWKEKIGENWVDIAGATSMISTIHVSDTTPTTHYYRIYASNLAGTVNSTGTYTYTSYKPPEYTGLYVRPEYGALTNTIELNVVPNHFDTLQWQENISGTWTDLAGGTTKSYIHNVTDTTPTVHSYRAKIVGTGGTIYTDVLTYTSYAVPVIVSATVTPTVGGLQQNITFNGSATGEITEYQWKELVDSSWVLLGTGQTLTYEINDTTPTLHTFKLFVVGKGGTAQSSDITYQSAYKPEIVSIDVNPSQGKLIETVTLFVVASHTDSYQWQEKIGGTWTDLAGKTSDEVIININDTVPTVHQYRVICKNLYGLETISDTVTYESMETPVIFKSVTINPPKGELTQSITLSGEVENANAYQWQQWNSKTEDWEDITGATTLTYTQEFTFNKEGKYYFRLVAEDTTLGTIGYSQKVTYQAGLETGDGLLSTTMAIVLMVIMVLLFIFSCVWLYHGQTIAILPMVASVIMSAIITVISAFGKVGDITYFSGIVNNAIVKDSTIDLISPALVVVFGFATGLMVVLTIYILAQVVVNLRREQEYSEDEYEG